MLLLSQPLLCHNRRKFIQPFFFLLAWTDFSCHWFYLKKTDAFRFRVLPASRVLTWGNSRLRVQGAFLFPSFFNHRSIQ
jgi:hypothetical protein